MELTEEDQLTPMFRLRCMICYYGSHFVLISFKPLIKQWVQFDDAKVTPLGDWPSVRDKMIRGRVMPIVLFYEHYDHDSTLT